MAPPHTYIAFATQATISSVKQSKTNVTPCLHRTRAPRQNTIEVIIISDAVYELMNEWCIYIVLYCVLFDTQSAYNHVGGGLSSTTTSVQHPFGWCDGCYRTTTVRSPHTSYRWRGERVIEPIKCMLSPHTSYRWRGERVIEPIKCMLSLYTSYRWRGERVIEPIKCMLSPHTSYRWRGERVIEPIKCMLSPHTSYRWRGERVIEPIKCMLSPHTSYRWRGERVIEPIKCMLSPHTSYRWRGERVIEPIKWMLSPHTSYRWRGERVIEPIKCMLSPHTSYRWRGERVMEPIKWMGIIRRPWLTRASGGNLASAPGLHWMHRGYTGCTGVTLDLASLHRRLNGTTNPWQKTPATFYLWHADTNFLLFQRLLYRIQCRQTNQSHLGVWSQAFSTPWVLSSAGKLIRSDIYMGPTSCIIVPQMFSSLIFYPSSLSFCRSAQLFTECSLSSMSGVDTPLTADWLHICFGTRPRLSFLKHFWKMTNPTFNKY